MAYPTVPTDPIPTIAADTVYDAPGEDWDGADTKVAPTGAIEAQGYVPGDARPADVDNYLFSVLAAWITYLVAYCAELLAQKVQGPATAVDNVVPRFDGTTGKLLQGSTVAIADTTGAITGAGTITYVAAKTHTIVVGPGDMVPAVSAYSYTKTTDGTGVSVLTDSAVFVVDLAKVLTNRCTIIGFAAYVNPGTGRSGANRMSVACWQAPSSGGAAVQIGATVFDDTTGSTQTLSSSLVSVAVDRSANAYTLAVKAGHDASSNPDSILHVTVTVLEAGPGLGV